MSILTKPISFKRDKSAAVASPAEAPAQDGGRPQESPSAGKPQKAPRAPKAAAMPQFAVSPRANLLPPEINENQRKRSTRRGLRMLVILVLAVALGGTAVAWYLAIQAEMRLVAAQEATSDLSAQRLEFMDVANTLTAISEGEAAQRVGGSTEIDWSSYLAQLQQTLPEGVTLTDVAIDSANASIPYAQSEVPLEGARIATLTFTADSPVLPSIPDWIDRLSSLPGFADAAPGSISTSEGVFSASVTMHINADAYTNRFAPEVEEEQE